MSFPHAAYVSSRRGGALLVMTGILMATVALSALAINVAYMQYTRTELQITSDVATRAACRALVDTGLESAAYTGAQRLANVNRVAGKVLLVEPGDLEFAAATRMSAAEKYSFTHEDHPNAVRFSAGFFQRSRNALPMLMPAYSMSTQFKPFKEATAAQAELDIAIVLDCSSSMLSPAGISAPPEGLLVLPLPVPPGARWSTVRTGIQAMLNSFRQSPQHERVALTTFNNVSLLNTSLTSQYSMIEAGLALHGQVYTGGLTSIGDGINSAVTMLNMKGLARPWASRVILLVSDGRSNFGPSPLTAARNAASGQIMIYTISLGVDADRTQMKQIADLSYGKHIHATSSADFLKIIEDVNEHLPILITR